MQRLRDEQYWLMTGCLLFLSFMAFSFVMYFTRDFMVPFVFAIFLVAMVTPIDNLLVVRLRCPRWLGYVLSLAVIMGLIAGIVLFLTYAVNSISNTMWEFEINTSKFAEKGNAMLQYFGVPEDFVNARDLLAPIRSNAPTMFKQVISLMQTFVLRSTMVLLFCLFILMGRNPHHAVTNKMYSEVEKSFQKYLNIKFLISALTGLSVYVTFLCLELPLAGLFALLAFALNFIPSIGSIIATLLPLPLAIITPGFTNTGIVLVVLIPTIVQSLLGNIIEPKLQGKGLKLHPVTILLALGYWGVVWGPVGMLLAAPLTSAMRFTMLEFKSTRWIAALMSGNLPEVQELANEAANESFNETLDEETFPEKAVERSKRNHHKAGH